MNMLDMFCLSVWLKLKAFAKEERGAVDIVAIVVMIGIAVLLAVVFRKEIEKLLETLFGTISRKATEAVGG